MAQANGDKHRQAKEGSDRTRQTEASKGKKNEIKVGTPIVIVL